MHNNIKYFEMFPKKTLTDLFFSIDDATLYMYVYTVAMRSTM